MAKAKDLPQLDLPDDVAKKYEGTTVEALEDAAKTMAVDSLMGHLMGINMNAGDRLDFLTEVITGAIEQTHDLIAQDMSDEHARVFLDYVDSGIKQVKKVK